ncbi:hypothetical protein GIHI108528_11725 [Gillisia hiemivivida]
MYLFLRTEILCILTHETKNQLEIPVFVTDAEIYSHIATFFIHISLCFYIS